MVVSQGAVEQVQRARGEWQHAVVGSQQAMHVHYRVWRPHCAAGRMDNPPHRRALEVDSSVVDVPLSVPSAAGRAGARWLPSWC